ncbi:UDP-glycosyltransferase 83A1-like, partial [Salvia splendens]|uniref:UDP-glycosyltransferase 83A1-like n=1 Tax=Salvia splendens TaxID=180675 RepID=UPI001C254571
PIGPLNLLNSNNSTPTNFYSEDSSCLSWLDIKPVGSVVYVSFGSSAFFSQQQLDELALDLANGSPAVYPDGFLERVSEVGKIVGWAPQDRLLSHPSIACFLSHCGWNSTMEGTCKGVPFLCWSYFSDQYHNERYIGDVWKNGLKMEFDEEGIRSRHEIKKKISMVFFYNKFKENAVKLKEICCKSIGEGGWSYKNLEKFIDHLGR